MLGKTREKFTRNQKGFSIPELLVVLLIAAIILALALPQIISSRRLMKFASIQRQVASTLTETRQEAMSQRRAVTFRYDNRNKRITIHGGSFGDFGNANNKIVELSGFGITTGEIMYGRPNGVSTAALGDRANLTNLSSNLVNVTFQPDGTVLDASGNPENKALFFYDKKRPVDTAFAVSVLGAGGRVKIWRYSQTVNQYVE
jgi:prepilin-type N-terminal cleavage/methylation domain-containing protein